MRGNVCGTMKVQDMIQRGKSRVNVSALALEYDGVQELAASFTVLGSCAAPWSPQSRLCCFPDHVWSLPAGDIKKLPPFCTGQVSIGIERQQHALERLLGGGTGVPG